MKKSPFAKKRPKSLKPFGCFSVYADIKFCRFAITEIFSISFRSEINLCVVVAALEKFFHLFNRRLTGV